MRSRCLGAATAVVVALAIAGPEGTAQCTDVVLRAHDPQPSAFFGSPMDSDGRRILVGAFGLPALYVFESMDGAWVETHKIETWAPLSLYNPRTIAIDGTTIVTGNEHTPDGEIYVYELVEDQWVLVQTIRGFGPTSDGRGVVLDGDRMIIQDSPFDEFGAPQGVGVWDRRDGVWMESARLTHPQIVLGAGLFDLDGDVAVVEHGPHGDGLSVFEWAPSGWVLAGDIYPPPGVEADFFGRSFVVDGERIAVGAELDVEAGDNIGAVYVYDRGPDGWEFGARIPNPQGDDFDLFGTAVALREDLLLIGAENGDSHFVQDSGTAHLYRKDEAGWAEVATYEPLFPEPNGSFARSVFLQGRVPVVSQDSSDLGEAVNVGSVSILDIDTIFEETNLGFDLQPVLGGPPRLWTLEPGCPGQWIQFRMSDANVFHGVPLALIVGRGAAYAPFMGGTLVPAPEAILLSHTTSSFNGSKTWQGVLPLNLPPALDLYLQVWYADPGGPEGWVASNGLRVTVP